MTTINNGIQITLYLVGVDSDDAQGNFPFDSAESAESYSRDNPGTKVYNVDAWIDFDSIEEA